MTTMPRQAISGVSAGADQIIMTVFPSIAASGLGQALGKLYDCIPWQIFRGVRLSHLIFPLLTAPLPALMYLGKFVFGKRYVLKSRGLEVRPAIGSGFVQRVELKDIADVVFNQHPGQRFYRAADLVILGKGDQVLMTLKGVPHAESFRRTILKAVQARIRVEAALATIQKRS